MVKSCGSVYMFVTMNWSTHEVYLTVEHLRNKTRCDNLSDAERVYQFECGGDGLHNPCMHRKRETRDGVEMDWCYAIGCEQAGDMPCEYCADKKAKKKGDKNGRK